MSDEPPRGSDSFVLVGMAMLVCSLLVGPALSTAAVPSTAEPAALETNERWLRAVAPAESYDSVDVRIDVAANGSALWYVAYRYDLPTESAVSGFERTQANITNPPGTFVTRFEKNVVAAAASQTGRSMGLENGQVQTELDVTANEGVVVYQFRWTNFAARPSNGKIVAGDAIAGYDLGANESLMIEWPDRLESQSVSPDPDFDQTNAVRWTGPLAFRTEDPTVVLRGGGSSSSGLPISPAVIASGLLALIVLGWYGHKRVRDGSDGTETAAVQTDSTQTDAETDSTQTDAETDSTQTDAETDSTQTELLSDEERVLRLLDKHGGRMKQQDLIDAVDWSRTKASDVVNEMHENEQIELFRLGRENVLALPGEIEI